ncbi:hypothetical protein U1Q18_015589, partial [Sarracenia purpurea var. burkii]
KNWNSSCRLGIRRPPPAAGELEHDDRRRRVGTTPANWGRRTPANWKIANPCSRIFIWGNRSTKSRTKSKHEIAIWGNRSTKSRSGFNRDLRKSKHEIANEARTDEARNREEPAISIWGNRRLRLQATTGEIAIGEDDRCRRPRSSR